MTLQLLRGHDTAEAGNDDDDDADDDDDDDNDIDFDADADAVGDVDAVPTSEGDDVTMNDAMQ